MYSVSVIGVGRVGGALAISLPRHKYNIETLVTRDPDAIAGAEPRAVSPEDLDHLSADILFITTQDSEITDSARFVAARTGRPGCAYHTSGALASTALQPLQETGWSTGSIHPLVSISSPEVGPSRFRGAFFCIEGEDKAVRQAKEIVEDLGGRPFSIDTRFKTLYHAAAVTACGHLVALFDASVEMLNECGLSDEQAKTVLLPLIKSTVENVGDQSLGEALTGTFARADIDTFTRHIAALNELGKEDLLEIYLLLGERSLELAAKRGISPLRIEKFKAKVAIAKSKLKW